MTDTEKSVVASIFKHLYTEILSESDHEKTKKYAVVNSD